MPIFEHHSLYCDHNATSPFSLQHWQEVGRIFASGDLLKASSQKNLAGAIGNPSSPHAAGRKAQTLLSQARRRVASSLRTDPSEVIFVSSATEANNIVVRSFSDQTLLIDAAAHPSIIEPAREEEGPAAERVLTVSPRLDEDPEDLATRIIGSLHPKTRLLALMAANNETGHTTPVALLGDWLQSRRYGTGMNEARFERLDQALPQGLDTEFLKRLHLHVDATQAFGKLPTDTWTSIGIDSLAISGHKVGALPGSAALIVRRGRSLKPLMSGGGQERKRRPGTENLPAIVSLGLRAEELDKDEHWRWTETTREVAHRLEERLQTLSGCLVLSRVSTGLPNTIHFLADETQHIYGEDLLIELDLAGISASSGSACASGTNRPSHVVLSLGFSANQARNAIRLSLGPGWTHEGIEHLAQTLEAAWNRSLQT